MGATPASSNTTPKKSQYFGHQTDESDPETEVDEEGSGYEGEETDAVSSTPVSEEAEGDEDDYSEEEASSRRPTGRKKDGNASGASKGQELWRPGVKTGLGPGKQVLIKIPKARESGKTPYKDDTIHPNTMLFLRDLAGNNDREWLKSEPSYLGAAFQVVTGSDD